MASGDRFYQMDLRHRPALHGDVGSLLKIEGIVIGGEGARAVLLLPSADLWETKGQGVYTLTPEQWTDWLQRSDNPEILINGSLEKAFHRKLRYDISGHVQQKIWAADGFKCMFCFQPFGKVQMTIDHFWPLEQGGKNDTSNFISACRACNKSKGGMSPEAWIEFKKPRWQQHDLGLQWYVQYLEKRQIS